MKKSLLIISSLALLAVAGCNKEFNNIPNPSTSNELAFIPMNGRGVSHATKGYVEESKFVGTTYESLHGTKSQNLRTMQISAYLTPQNGEAKNYFVDKTYSAKTTDLNETIWWNTNTAGGDHDPIYWPVGGTLDFLAYSLSSEKTGAGKSYNIEAVWDNTNAAQKVTLKVPGENTQNDILFASAYNVKSRNTATPVNMTFNHSQAWLEFILTGSVDDVNKDGIVNVKRIELEDVYNAGVLTITNNGGNAIAKWDFSDEDKQNIAVDDFNSNLKLSASPKYLDMLIPQQNKTAFVIYYTLGSDAQELSYRFTPDQKTWLMGEKYIYKINITTSEVTVAPIVTIWNGPVQGFEYTVKTPATTVGDGETTFGTVNVSFSPSTASFKKESEETDGSATYTCDTWCAQITLTAQPNGDAVFVKWSDDVTENPRTFTISEDAKLPEAIFGYEITSSTSSADISRCTPVTETYIAGKSATIKAAPAKDGYKFFKWCNDATCIDYMDEGENAEKGITVNGDKITIASVNAKQTFYAKYIPEDVISGAFSVSAVKKVFFAKGNLYWDGSKFGFEADQTAFSSTWDPNHVSHFYWSQSADVAVAKTYDDSGASSGDSFFAANGGAIEGYTVLSDSEWTYLLKTRTVRGGKGKNHSFRQVCYNTINGVLLYPDDYDGELITDTDKNWKEISVIPEGCAFLPVSGYRSDSTLIHVGGDGCYWSSVQKNETEAYSACFFDFDLAVNKKNRIEGHSVRLVSE